MDALLTTTPDGGTEPAEPTPTVVHRTVAWQRSSGWWLGWGIEVLILALATLTAALVAVAALAGGSLPLVALWAPIFLMNGIFTWSTLSRLADGQVRIGADGVCVRRTPLLPLARRRFVHFGRLDEVGVTRNGHVERRTGDRVVAFVHEPMNPRGLARDIVQARKTFRERRRVDVPQELVREGRPLDRWCDEIEERVRRGDDRASPLSPAMLVRVAEDPAVDAPTRAVSATVATRTGTDEERIRILAAIECTASPRLSHVLAEAAEGRLDTRSLEKAEADERA